MRESEICTFSDAQNRSFRLRRKYKKQLEKLQSESEYSKFLEKLPPKEKVFLLSDYGYKFSKSNVCLSEYFVEGWYTSYIPNTLSRDSGHGLSFMIDKSILLKASVYGDLLTRFSFKEQDACFSDVRKAKIVYEGGMLDTYCSNVLYVEHNFPMSCPYTIKALVKACRSNCALSSLLSPKGSLKYRTLKETYKVLGFHDSAKFLQDIEQIFAETPCYITVQDKLNSLLPGDITI